MSEQEKKELKEDEDDILTDEDEVVELIDDDGNVVNFYWVGTIEYQKNMYVAFEPAETHEDEEEGEVVIFKLDEDEEGSDVFTPVEDEKLLNAVFEEFIKLQEEQEKCSCNEEGCGSHNCSCNCKKS